MTVERCANCKGAKKIMGLGMMMRDCSYCAGVGFVKPKAVEVMVKTRKKREPKIKVSDEREA